MGNYNFCIFKMRKNIISKQQYKESKVYEEWTEKNEFYLISL